MNVEFPQFGATPLKDGQTRFRLWAPAQNDVSVVLEARRSPADAARRRMVRGGNRMRRRHALSVPIAGWHDGAGPGLAVPAGGRAWAERGDRSARIRWRNADWAGRPWQEAVIYELHAGCFGGFAGVTAELPRLARLGITALELMPIGDFPGRHNWGYDGVLPFAPDRRIRHARGPEGADRRRARSSG